MVAWSVFLSFGGYRGRIGIGRHLAAEWRSLPERKEKLCDMSSG